MSELASRVPGGRPVVIRSAAGEIIREEGPYRWQLDSSSSWWVLAEGFSEPGQTDFEPYAGAPGQPHRSNLDDLFGILTGPEIEKAPQQVRAAMQDLIRAVQGRADELMPLARVYQLYARGRILPVTAHESSTVRTVRAP